MKPFERDQAGNRKPYQQSTCPEKSGTHDSDVELHSLCRICGRFHNHRVVSVYCDAGAEIQLEDKINNYLPITVSKHDKLPTHVCYSCIEKLNITHELILSCFDANKRFINYLQSEDRDDLIPDIELFSDSESISDEIPQLASELTAHDPDISEQDNIPDPVEKQRYQVKYNENLLRKAVITMSYSKVRNLSATERVEKALEYVEYKENELGLVGNLTSTKCFPQNLQSSTSDFNSDDQEKNSVLQQLSDSNTSKNVLITDNSSVHECSSLVTFPSLDKCSVISKTNSPPTTPDISMIYVSSLKKQVGLSSDPELNSKIPSGRIVKAMDLLKSKKMELGLVTNSTSSKSIVPLTVSGEHNSNSVSSDVYFQSNRKCNSKEVSQYFCPDDLLINSFEVNRCSMYSGSVEIEKRGQDVSHSAALKYEESNCHFMFPHFNYDVANVKSEPNGVSFQENAQNDVGPGHSSYESDESDGNEKNMYFLHNEDSNCKCGSSCCEDVESHACSKSSFHCTCKVCNKYFNDVDKYTLHKHMHATNSVFECHLCGEKFSRKYSLHLHQLSHSKEKPHQCKFCSRRFLLRSSLESHVANEHSSEKIWLCDQCGETFHSKSSLQGHARSHENGNMHNTYSCKICNKYFHDCLVYNKHMKSHNLTFDCNGCNKSFISEKGLKKHEALHMNVPVYQCSICLVNFNRKSNLTKHYKTHATEKIVTCRICKATFPSVAGLLNHRKTHTAEEVGETKFQHIVEGENAMSLTESFQCGICNKVLSSKLSLNLHKRVHTGEKPYECQQCHKRFTQKPALTYHLRLHTGERPHTCQFCGKGFNSKVGKESHERIHTGERPYTCGQCGAGFRCSANLRQHSWIHSEERPYECLVCGKLFRRREALQVHNRIHTGERPYSCPICGRCFTQKGDMVKHTRSHSKRSDATVSVACQYCGQVYNHKKYFKLHLKTCKECPKKFAVEEEVLEPIRELVPLKEENEEVKNEEIQELNHVTLAADDIVIALPEITIVTDNIQEYDIHYN